jgi:hypothetical protein
MQFRQRQRIPSVSLHPLACLERNQRGRDDDAVIPQPAQQSIQTIAAGTSLTAEVQVMPTTRQPFNHLSQHIDVVFECPKMANLTTTPALGDCHRDSPFVHVKSNKDARVHLARLPCLRLSAAIRLNPRIVACREAGRLSSSCGEHRV